MKKKLKKVKKIKKQTDLITTYDRNDGKTGHRTDAGQRLLMAKIAVKIAESKGPEEICDELNIPMQAYNKYRDRLYMREEASLAGKTELQVYTDYVIKQTKLMKDLEELKTNFNKSRQYAALVGAVRTQSDILDKLIARGQELGIISKTPESINVIGGLDIRSMSDVAIRNQIRDELDRGQRLLASIKKPKPIKVITPGREEVDLEELEPEGEA